MPVDRHDVAPQDSVRVLERHAPLPVIVHDRQQAQQLADRLRWTPRTPTAAGGTTPPATRRTRHG